MTKTSVLVIDDELQIRRFLKVALEPHEFEFLEADAGRTGLVAATQWLPDVIILDLGLPDMDGIEVLKKLRDWYEKPILILSVRDDEQSIINALNVGADDYVTKPFSIGELVARIHVALRHRVQPSSEPIMRAGNIEIDIPAHRVCVKGAEVKLTATEFDLLKLLLRFAGKVLTHQQILKEVWGPNAADQVQYLRVYIGHLRQKIEEDPNQPKLIITEPGVGYRFAAI